MRTRPVGSDYALRNIQVSFIKSEMNVVNERIKIAAKCTSKVGVLQDGKNKNFSDVWEKVKKYIQEYCRMSSIHGVRYFGEKRRTVFEKVWWVIAIIVSCSFCFTRIIDAYHRWQRSPVIVSFATEPMPIWQIPFPAVTICPDTKSDPQIFNFTDVYHRKMDNKTLSKKESDYFDYLSLICDDDYLGNYSLLYVDHDDIYDFFDNVTAQFKKSIVKIDFMREEYGFDNAFTSIITDEGVCYSFNILDRREIFTDVVKHYKDYQLFRFTKTPGWTLEFGYRRDSGKDAYPRRALFAEATWAFDIDMLVSTKSTDFICSGGIQGYKVQIHNPAKIARVRQQFFRVPFDQFVVAAVTPSMMLTSQDVKDYSPAKRKCFFSTERPLRFFKFYTQENCMMECKTNYSLKYCGCVDFFMPHDNEMLICGAASGSCMNEAEGDFVADFIESKLETSNVWKKEKAEHNGFVHDCNCLPVCNFIEYSLELSQNDWDWEKHLQAKRIMNEQNNSFTKGDFHASHLKIFFKTDQFFPSQRHQLYGTTDFLANFGGLLGLFIGFSVLSFIEIIYFLTVRIMCNVHSSIWCKTNSSNVLNI